jgi:hypothetical protein
VEGCGSEGRGVVVEVRAPALFVCLGGGVEENHSCEVVLCLAPSRELWDSMYSRRRKKISRRSS